MKLYAFSINGTMLYALGNLSTKEMEYLEKFNSKNILDCYDNLNKQDFLNAIFKYLNITKNICLTPINIDHVFRYTLNQFQ